MHTRVVSTKSAVLPMCNNIEENSRALRVHGKVYILGVFTLEVRIWTKRSNTDRECYSEMSGKGRIASARNKRSLQAPRVDVKRTDQAGLLCCKGECPLARRQVERDVHSICNSDIQHME